ncbi:NADH-quinone oxidoreductase subunit NuoE family protein [Desertivirga xinjiangensis]|uniref:NADH-quinone oxidoreductase subunit NuoE family protein n=1 Tax=Desertivirga xinjiangensis TaxID=539206 RepID=UPI00210F0D16|nr:NAD(P)H-dependent oxidoreductase subunit E [Pedobacter xinjiangensis]
MLKISDTEDVIFSPELLSKFAEIVSRYPEGRQKSALLPILHLVQAQYGWVSSIAMDKVADYLELKPIEVYEVATFYTMFFLKPQGKYVLEVCRTGPCSIVGAERIMKYIENKLQVKEGEVTEDGLFSWRGVECLAACGMAPVLQIGPDYTYYENLTEAKIDELIDSLRLKTVDKPQIN